MSYLLVTGGPAHGCQPENRAPCMNQSQALFRRFHCFSAPRVMKMRCRRLMPKVLVDLGHLRGLIYTSDRGRRDDHKTYIHFMETPPQLACDPQGRQLYILGGRYRVTSRGIEG